MFPIMVTKNPMNNKRNGSKAFGPPANWLFCDNASGMISHKNPSIKNNKKAISVPNTKPNPVFAKICRPLNIGGSKPSCALLKLFGSFMIIEIDKVLWSTCDTLAYTVCSFAAYIVRGTCYRNNRNIFLVYSENLTQIQYIFILVYGKTYHCAR